MSSKGIFMSSFQAKIRLNEMKEKKNVEIRSLEKSVKLLSGHQSIKTSSNNYFLCTQRVMTFYSEEVNYSFETALSFNVFSFSSLKFCYFKGTNRIKLEIKRVALTKHFKTICLHMYIFYTCYLGF
jgi:hypothetical protein